MDFELLRKEVPSLNGNCVKDAAVSVLVSDCIGAMGTKDVVKVAQSLAMLANSIEYQEREVKDYSLVDFTADVAKLKADADAGVISSGEYKVRLNDIVRDGARMILTIEKSKGEEEGSTFEMASLLDQDIESPNEDYPEEG